MPSIKESSAKWVWPVITPAKPSSCAVGHRLATDKLQDAAPALGFLLQPLGQLLVDLGGELITKTRHLSNKRRIEGRIKAVAMKYVVWLATHFEAIILPHGDFEEPG